jgi:transaldolase
MSYNSVYYTSMLAKNNSSLTQAQIAAEIGCDQSTVSDDIKVLKQMSQRWLFDLAKEEICYYFNQSIDSIEQAKA